VSPRKSWLKAHRTSIDYSVNAVDGRLETGLPFVGWYTDALIYAPHMCSTAHYARQSKRWYSRVFLPRNLSVQARSFDIHNYAIFHLATSSFFLPASSPRLATLSFVYPPMTLKHSFNFKVHYRRQCVRLCEHRIFMHAIWA
jgi:hypothetical protein